MVLVLGRVVGDTNPTLWEYNWLMTGPGGWGAADEASLDALGQAGWDALRLALTRKQYGGCTSLFFDNRPDAQIILKRVAAPPTP